MLRLTNVKKTYKSGKNIKNVLKDINLEIKKGEIFGFIGANGAGKTTTIKIATGILNYDSGKVEICGIDMKKKPLEAKRRFGYVSDSHYLYENLTGQEYINFMADIYGVGLKERKKRAEELIEMFELTNAINSYIASYSHGMKQKISIIGSLIHEPDLWILDEPLMGLDPKSSFVNKELMRKYSALGKSVFFSTHILEVAEKLCDRVGIIADGVVVKVGKLEDIKRDSSLEDYFFEVSLKEDKKGIS